LVSVLFLGQLLG